MPPSTTSNQIVRDGDSSFLGLQSRRNPLTIPAGYLQASSNVRLDRGIAQTRKGAKQLATGLSSAGLPVTEGCYVIDAAITSITRSGNTATATYSSISPANLVSGMLVQITGADQSAYNSSGVTITVPSGSTNTFTYQVSGSPTTPATFTAGGGSGNLGYPIAQSTYTAGIYAAGIFSSPALDNANEYVVLAGSNSAYCWRDGVNVTTLSYPTSPISETIQPGDVINFVQAFDKFFLFRWRASDAPISVSSITQAAGTATVTTAAAHAYTTGEVVRLTGSDQAGFNLDGVIAVTSPTTFTIPVNSGTAANTSPSLMAQRVCAPLVWDGISSGFARVPSGVNTIGPTYSNLISPYGGIACYFNNQLVVANARDGAMVSDVLNPYNFDPLLKSFRTNQGSNDHLVAIHPYAEGQVIIFLRKSIYLGKLWIASDGVSIDPNTSYLQLLTTEVGCNARQTVATAGTYVYFLSDNGVYRLDNSQIDLALRGNSLPLSEPISDIIATINPAAVSQAVGIYFNNRYYLAVAINGSPFNNALLIYNQLNEAWETMDTYAFSLDSLVISDYGSARRLFVASQAGFLYLLEQYDSGSDDGLLGVPYPVAGSITTRRLFYGQLARKRLGNLAASVLIPDQSSVEIDAITTDPDNTTAIASVTNTQGVLNDFTIRAPIRREATYLDVKMTTSGGRPTIRAVSADASISIDPSRLSRTES